MLAAQAKSKQLAGCLAVPTAKGTVCVCVNRPELLSSLPFWDKAMIIDINEECFLEPWWTILSLNMS